jgi:hypothetical protein
LWKFVPRLGAVGFAGSGCQVVLSQAADTRDGAVRRPLEPDTFRAGPDRLHVGVTVTGSLAAVRVRAWYWNVGRAA